jgi:hypothetical protein
MTPLLFDGEMYIIGKTQNITETFTKREFVLKAEIEGKIQEVKFEFLGEQGKVLDNYKVGEQVTVAFVIRGNAYQDKHFVNLKAVAIGQKLSENDSLRNDKVAERVITRPVVVDMPPTDDDLPF